MKRAILLAASAVLLSLSWLALDDLTTSSEPNFFLETTVVTVCLLWFAVLAVARLTRGGGSASG